MTTNCSNSDCPKKDTCRRWLDKGGNRKKFELWNGECDHYFADETLEERLEAIVEEKRERFRSVKA